MQADLHVGGHRQQAMACSRQGEQAQAQRPGSVPKSRKLGAQQALHQADDMAVTCVTGAVTEFWGALGCACGHTEQLHLTFHYCDLSIRMTHIHTTRTRG